MNGRELPQNLDAERAVLGGMLLHRDGIEDALEVIGRDDFYLPRHQSVFDAITDLAERGDPADVVTVAKWLEDRGELTRVGGPIFLHDCMDAIPTAANTGHYAELVREKAVLRRLVEVGRRIEQMGFETDGDDIEEIVARAHDEAFSVTARREVEESSQADSAMRVADRLETESEPGVMTGFADLDELTGGLKPGQLVIIGARAGTGKTTLCADVLRHVSIKQGGHSAMFSLEMTHDEITARLFSAEARIPLHHMRPGHMTEDDWSRFGKHYGDVATAAIHVDDSEDLTLMKVITRARKMVKRYPIKVIAVDYFQMLDAGNGKRYESREREAAAIIYGLKRLAKQLRVPVIALAQLNRGPANRADKTPQMSDIRETGVAEQACDIGILIHREDMYERESPRAGEADLIVAKHRGGPRATVTVAFQGHFSRFVDMQGDDYRGGAR